MVLRAGFHGTVGQPSAQVIDGSLKFDDDSSQYLNRTPSSAGNKTVWSFSFWIKLNKVDGQRQIFSVYNDSSNDSLIKINSNGYLEIWNYIGGAYKTQYISNARFRDHSAWYHFFISCNGSTSLSAWVNGVAITFSTSTGPDGTDWLFNGTNSHQIGRYNTTANSDFQLTQVNWIDGHALEPTDFGFTDPLTNTWRPKKYTGSVNAPESGFGGTVWSSYVTNGSTGGTAPSKAFNGSIANNTGYDESNWTRSASNGNTPAVFDVSGVASMADVTEVKVYAYVADSQNNGTILAVNDVNQATSGQSGFQVYTVDVTGNGLDTIKYKYVSGSGPYCYLTGVTVSINGGAHQELIDGSGAPAGVNGFYLPMDGNSPI